MITNKFLWLITTLVILGISSCVKNEIVEPNEDLLISFVKKEGNINDWNNLVKSSSELPVDTMLKLHGAGDTLVLNASYSNDFSEFGTNKADTTDTRAKIREIKDIFDFAVSAYSYTGNFDPTIAPNYINNTFTRKDLRSNTFQLVKPYNWPGATYKMRFYAWSPARYNYLSSMTLSESKGAPKLNITANPAPLHQMDFVVAKSGEINGDYNKTLELNFEHVMAGVQVESSSQMVQGMIDDLTFHNIYNSGTYDVESGTWENLSNKSFVSMDTRYYNSLGEMSANAGDKILADKYSLMLIPQTLGDDAYVELTYRVKTVNAYTSQFKLRASLKGVVLQKGTILKFQVGTPTLKWQPVLEVSQPEPVSYTGGSTKFGMRAVWQIPPTGNETFPTIERNPPVSIDYSTDGGETWTNNKPDWFDIQKRTTAPLSDPNGLPYYEISVSPTPEIKQGGWQMLENLKAATELGNETTPYNLSNETGGPQVQNTANCYVVNAPGVYSFPLVYGNAIKNSQKNEKAYTSLNMLGKDWSKLDDDQIINGIKMLNLTTYLNHLGHEITDPYISKNKDCVPSKAELLWQDSKDLLTNIQYVPGDNGGNIQFKINRETITNGNAVIAIKNSDDEIMWSWHIWVTGYDIKVPNDITTKNGKIYKFLPATIGELANVWITHEARECLVRYTTLNKSQIIKVAQQASSDITPLQYGGVTYFQWGRKDPMPPGNGEKLESFKTLYDNSGMALNVSENANFTNWNFTSYTFKERIAYSIKNPTKLVKGLDPYVYKYYIPNLWASIWTNNGETMLYKNIYDPSPIGYMLPSKEIYNDVFPFLSDKKETWSSYLKLDPIQMGLLIYTKQNHDDNSQFYYLPLYGVISAKQNSLGLYISSNASYWYIYPPNKSRIVDLFWTNTPGCVDCGFALWFTKFLRRPINISFKTNSIHTASIVWPIKEYN